MGGALGWRAAFWLEAICMAPFALFCLLAPPLNIKRVAGPSGGKISSGLMHSASIVRHLAYCQLCAHAEVATCVLLYACLFRVM